MVRIYKSKEVDIPNTSYIKQLSNQIIGLGIDFGPILLPVIVYLFSSIYKLDSNLFVILYSVTLIISLVWLYLLIVNFHNIKVTKHTFHSSKISHPIKFVFISDIHIGKNWEETHSIRLNRIINKINNLDKDFILIGGDIINHNFTPDLITKLGGLNGTKICVLGNHDNAYVISGYHTKETPIDLIKKLQESDIDVLINSGKSFSDQIYIGGIKDLYTLDFDISKSMQNSTPSQFKILLSHNPDIISYEEELRGIDLVLSGHNHSGQINILGITLPMPTKRKWLTHGIFTLKNKTTLLLSSGIGASNTRIRIGTKFEIVSVELLPQG